MIKLHKILIVFIVTLTLFLSAACTKQSSPDVDEGIQRGQEEVERLEACTQTNFNFGVLLHRNLLLLFQCTRWDKDFPELYKSLTQIQGNHWDHFIEPINKEFIENLKRRDRVFSSIRTLDAQNGLNDLSKVLIALNEDNFFDALKSAFECVENPASAKCLQRRGEIKRQDFKNIFSILKAEEKTLKTFLNFLNHFNSMLESHPKELSEDVRKFYQSPGYVKARLMLFDSMMRKVQAGLDVNDRTFLTKVLRARESKSETTWIYNWLRSSDLGELKFDNLLKYPISGDPALFEEARGFKKAYSDSFTCTIKSDENPNQLVEFDVKKYVDQFETIYKERSYKNYYEYSSSLLFGLSISEEICKEVRRNDYGVDFFNLFTKFNQFNSEKKYYEFVKFLIQLPVKDLSSGDNFTTRLYLFDFFISDVFTSFNNLNKEIVEKAPDFYKLLLKILNTVDPVAHDELGHLLGETLSVDSQEKLESLSRFWLFLNDKEKNFLFNFIDRHYDEGTNFNLLFTFYETLLVEFIEVQPLFIDRWLQDDQKLEASYAAVEDISKNLAGEKTLADLKKFLSRDQILKVLEVLSGGSKIIDEAQEELRFRYSSAYLANSQIDKFSLEVKAVETGNYDATAFIGCMQAMNKVEGGLYIFVRELPNVCQSLTSDYIGLKFFSWLNHISETYQDKNGVDLLDKTGILNPHIINTTVGNISLFDSVLAKAGSALPIKGGVEYFLTSMKYHLEKLSLKNLLDKNVKFVASWFKVEEEKNLIHRNGVVKKATSETSTQNIKGFFNNLPHLLKDYQVWYGKNKESAYAKVPYDAKFKCESVINQFVALNPCPSKETVKKYAKEMAFYFTKVWEKSEGSALSHLIPALKTGEGIKIPLNVDKQEKYRMTVKETLGYFYDSFDRSLPVNNLKMLYVHQNGKSSYENLTTLERIEVVIRDVRFGHNYLGVAFLNAVTQTNDYNEEVSDRKKLLQRCLKIPGIRCSKPITKDELRMANNAVEAFDSLLDINNGRGKGSKLQYGKFLQTFEQTLVASSAKDAQEKKFLALKDDLLVLHNGRMLSNMVLVNTWSNAARVLSDRVGRTRADFDKFISSNEIARIDKMLLYGFDVKDAVATSERLVDKLAAPQSNGASILDDSIDWIASLNYEESRIFEETLAKLLVVSTYLGSPDVVYGEGFNDPTLKERYKNNNLFQIFKTLERGISFYSNLKSVFPQDASLINVIRPINRFVSFMADQLSENKPNVAYYVLNDVFSALDLVLFEKVEDPRMDQSNLATVEGVDLLLKSLESKAFVDDFYKIIQANYTYLSSLHTDEAAWFGTFAENLTRVMKKEELSFIPYRDYLEFTAKNYVCQYDLQDCARNKHFDEVALLVDYLATEDKEGKTNLAKGLDTLFVKNFDQIDQLLKDVLPAVKVKAVKIPLR